MDIVPKQIPLTFHYTKFPNVEEQLKKLQNFRIEAQSAHKLARHRMLKRMKGKEPPFKTGDLVWLDSRNLKTTYASKKLAPRCQGPFEIIKTLGPLSYRLKLPHSWKIHDVFHVTLLSPFTETEVHGPNFPQPLAELINGEEEYKVEAILKHKKRQGKPIYIHVQVIL